MQSTGKSHREFNVRLNNNHKDINHLIPISLCKHSNISTETINLENIVYELQINALDGKGFLIKKVKLLLFLRLIENQTFQTIKIKANITKSIL